MGQMGYLVARGNCQEGAGCMEGQAGDGSPKVEADQTLAQLHIPHPHLHIGPDQFSSGSCIRMDLLLLLLAVDGAHRHW